MSKKKKSSKASQERIKARVAYAHRNQQPPDPYWVVVADLMTANGFAWGGQDFDEWRHRQISNGVKPDQALEYSRHYGLSPYWKALSRAKVRNLGEWFVALGLAPDVQFYGVSGAREVVDEIVRLSNAGYTSSQVRAWRAAGLTPDEVEDPTKPVVIVMD